MFNNCKAYNRKWLIAGYCLHMLDPLALQLIGLQL